jgi:hypothetical protein
MARILLVAGLLCCAACLLGTGRSATEKKKDECRRMLTDITQQLERQQMELKSAPGNETAQNQYLLNVLWLAYECKIYANADMDSLVQTTNDDLASVVERGIISSWPGNPLNNWEPVKVLQPGDGFSPGDICLTLCPDEYASTIGCGKTRVAFDMYIYGTTADAAPIGTIALVGSNKEWDTPPAGILGCLSYYIVSDKEREESRKNWHPAR